MFDVDGCFSNLGRGYETVGFVEAVATGVAAYYDKFSRHGGSFLIGGHGAEVTLCGLIVKVLVKRKGTLIVAVTV